MMAFLKAVKLVAMMVVLKVVMMVVLKAEKLVVLKAEKLAEKLVLVKDVVLGNEWVSLLHAVQLVYSLDEKLVV
jgi:hypothetical protein